MPTRPVESIHDSETDHPVQPNSTGVESPSKDQLQGASGVPPEGNADDTTAGDQDIDTAGTEHDEASVRHSALDLPKSDGGNPTERR